LGGGGGSVWVFLRNWASICRQRSPQKTVLRRSMGSGLPHWKQVRTMSAF
jgi:hypothetical protein